MEIIVDYIRKIKRGVNLLAWNYIADSMMINIRIYKYTKIIFVSIYKIKYLFFNFLKLGFHQKKLNENENDQICKDSAWSSLKSPDLPTKYFKMT